MQYEFTHQKEALENDRKKFINNGGTLVTKRPIPKPVIAPAHAKTIETVAKIGLRLPTLSQLNVVHSESAGTDLLLQDDESRQLEQLAKDFYHHVRWNFSDERKKLAEQTADKIVEHINEHLQQVSAKSHIEYINREKAFANRGGCIFHSHHLPKWAKNDPKKFFQIADKYEGKDNRRYMEIIFALPNELKTVEQYRQIIEPFIEKHLKDHYFTYAIHEKIGALSEGQRHPHVHIMFSERLIDDVEKIKERSPQNFFKYPARKKKDGSEPTFDEKFNRGAPKNRHWSEKSFLSVLRTDFAQIQNEVLKKNGFSIRVDHRTLKAQKANAEQRGDKFLAKLFDRVPEKYVEDIFGKEDDDPKILRLKKFRELRQQHFDLILKMDLLTKESEELDIKDDVQNSSVNAKKLIDSKEFLQANSDLKSKMFSAVAEVNKWKRILISYHDAEQQAKLEYMTKSERELWQQYQETLAQKKHLEDFLKTLRKPDESLKDALKSYDDIVSGVKKKIFALVTSSALLKKSVAEIENKLETPDCKKNILLVTHQILQSNDHAKKMLKIANDNLNRAVDALQNKLFEQTAIEKNIFKTREVYDIIRRQFFGLKKEYERTLDKKIDLQHKIFSSQRATEMAKNIFVHGGFKKLRSDFRRLKKDEEKFSKNLLAFKTRENFFKNRDWSADERSVFLQEKYFLSKQKTLLEIEKNLLENLKISLANRQIELENFCQKPDSQKKINLIAAGILRKNYTFVRSFEEVESKLKNLSQRIQHTKKQLDSLKVLLSLETRSSCYKIESPENRSVSSAASLIADAILREPEAVQLVAYCPDNPFEMDKTWSLMSELDKDALIFKEMVHDL